MRFATKERKRRKAKHLENAQARLAQTELHYKRARSSIDHAFQSYQNALDDHNKYVRGYKRRKRIHVIHFELADSKKSKVEIN